MPRGRFITLEGGEGSGKSTQARALVARLGDRGIAVLPTREPGGSEGAERIRTLLLDGAADRWTVEAEALLFAAARADHVARVIRPAIERGTWVVCDRFVDSSRAYQGASGLSDAALVDLHRFGSFGLMPDLTFWLDLPADVAAARARARDGAVGDRIGGRDAAFHAEVARRFAAIAAAEPARVRRIDADAAPDRITVALDAAIEALGWIGPCA